jgi:quercetin dioxygenase-like cupin family protein
MSITPAHATTGTDRRPGHILSGGGLVFRLSDEVHDLDNDLRRASGGRSAKTLAKADGLRVTLVVLDSGVTLDPEAAAGGATIQLLQGRLSVQCDGEQLNLTPGDLIVLPHNLREQVRAIDRSAFLITVAWPVGAGAWQQEATSGHL